ncbi:MAG: polyprenyl synthetase family protein [Pseudomonadota bacterium]
MGPGPSPSSDLRRGLPTVHIKWDEATAVLAGDALQTLAFEILAAPNTHERGDVRAALCLSLARASGLGGMVGGQMLDIAAESRTEHSAEQIERIQRLKTGALIEHAAVQGAILGEAGATDRQKIAAYACDLGSAYQIADDILDVTGDTAETGKAVRKDAEAGKATFVDLLGLDGATAKAHDLVQSACEHLSSFGAEADALRYAAKYSVNRRS